MLENITKKNVHGIIILQLSFINIIFKEDMDMKAWTKPEIETLGIENTLQGKDMSKDFDEIRVDQNGNYWVGFGSGVDSKPEIDGEVIVK